ncbi:restriction endonuclease subunit S [Devosia sp. A449]
MWDNRPSDWEVRRLSDITTRITRKNDGAGHLVMTISAKRGFMLQSDKYSRDMAGRSAERYTLLKKGEFAYNKGNSLTAPQGCIFRLSEASAAVPFVYYCFNIHKEIDAEYAAHAFQNGVLNRELARAINSGVRNDGLLNLPADDFFRCQISVPPWPEQHAIAEVLSATEGAIAKSEELIEALVVTKNGVLEERLRTGTEWAKSSSKGWRVCRLRDVATIQTGISKSKGRQFKRPLSVPYLRVANVQDGHLDLKEVKLITIEEDQIDRYSLQVGDVLFNEGGDFDKLGRGCVWPGQISPCVHQNHVFAVRCESTLNPEFLALLAASRHGKTYFRLSSKQTTNLASINTSDLRSFPVILPPMNEQLEIAALAKSFDARIAAEKEALDLLKKTRNALAQELLSGRVRVPENIIARHRDKAGQAA